MRILGIDPGLKATGYGFLDSVNGTIKLLEIGVIKTNPKDKLELRLKEVYNLLNTLLSQYNPDVMVLEKLYAHYKHPMTASILGHVRGVICLASAQNSVELIEQSPKRIRKAVIGNGNASKEQMRSAVSSKFSLQEKSVSLDASDAVSLALGYVYINKFFCGKGENI